MKNVSAPEMTSLAGSVTAIGSSLTLTDWGVVVGIATALLTCAFNMLYMVRKDRREQREADAAIAKLGGSQ